MNKIKLKHHPSNDPCGKIKLKYHPLNDPHGPFITFQCLHLHLLVCYFDVDWIIVALRSLNCCSSSLLGPRLSPTFLLCNQLNEFVYQSTDYRLDHYLVDSP